jgi:hypothetical protein
MGTLSPKQFLYHESHLNDRESIRSGGLRANAPGSIGWGEHAKTIPTGVYLSPHGHSEYGSSMNDSSHFGYDKWRVDVSGLPIHHDQFGSEGSKYTPESIPADRIKLVKKGHPNWEKHI